MTLVEFYPVYVNLVLGLLIADYVLLIVLLLFPNLVPGVSTIGLYGNETDGLH